MEAPTNHVAKLEALLTPRSVSNPVHDVVTRPGRDTDGCVGVLTGDRQQHDADSRAAGAFARPSEAGPAAFPASGLTGATSMEASRPNLGPAQRHTTSSWHGTITGRLLTTQLLRFPAQPDVPTAPGARYERRLWRCTVGTTRNQHRPDPAATFDAVITYSTDQQNAPAWLVPSAAGTIRLRLKVGAIVPESRLCLRPDVSAVEHRWQHDGATGPQLSPCDILTADDAFAAGFFAAAQPGREAAGCQVMLGAGLRSEAHWR